MRHTTLATLSVFVFLQSCKGSETRVQDSATTEDHYKIVATSEMSAVFGSQNGGCFGAKEATLLARAKGTVDESDLSETAFEIITDSNSKGLEQLFDIEASTTECKMDVNSSVYFAASEWSVSKVAKDNVVVTKPETVSFGEPGSRQIAVQIMSDIGSTPIKSHDEKLRCDLKNIRGQTFLVSIDESVPDIMVHVRSKLLPIFVSSQVMGVVGKNPSDPACASLRGRIYMPDFKCIKFGANFTNAADLNARFREGHQCKLAIPTGVQAQ